MPEPIDIYTYDPSITLPLSLPFKRNFNFLSIMKWEKRKVYFFIFLLYFIIFLFYFYYLFNIVIFYFLIFFIF